MESKITKKLILKSLHQDAIKEKLEVIRLFAKEKNKEEEKILLLLDILYQLHQYGHPIINNIIFDIIKQKHEEFTINILYTKRGNIILIF